MMSVTRRTETTISSSVCPERFTRAEPPATLMTESPMRALISGRRRRALGQLADFGGHHCEAAPLLTARAASTAAFRASRFVWNAISSIVVMISAIFLDAWLISPMAATASVTTWPVVSAMSRGHRPTGSPGAGRRSSGRRWRSAPPSVAAVSSSDAAWRWARRAISWAPPDEWRAASATVSAADRASRRVSRRFRTPLL
jgi:hypothetical protein